MVIEPHVCCPTLTCIMYMHISKSCVKQYLKAFVFMLVMRFTLDHNVEYTYVARIGLCKVHNDKLHAYTLCA